MLDTTVEPNTHPTTASMRDLLKDLADRRGASVNSIMLDAVRAGGSIQVVMLDQAAGTIDRLNQEDETALFSRVGELLDGTARAATINASHTRLGRVAPE
jgi:hypothetical protein